MWALHSCVRLLQHSLSYFVFTFESFDLLLYSMFYDGSPHTLHVHICPTPNIPVHPPPTVYPFGNVATSSLTTDDCHAAVTAKTMTSPSFGCNLSRLAGSVQPGEKPSRRGLGSLDCTLRPRRKQLLKALRHVAADTESTSTYPAESRAGLLHSGHHESRSCRAL